MKNQAGCDERGKVMENILGESSMMETGRTDVEESVWISGQELRLSTKTFNNAMKKIAEKVKSVWSIMMETAEPKVKKDPRFPLENLAEVIVSRIVE